MEKIVDCIKKNELPSKCQHLQPATFIETKGYLKPQDRGRLLRFQDQWGSLIKVVLLFQNGNLTLSKAHHSQTYLGWAKKNGFRAHDIRHKEEYGDILE
jgi:hypothetical protein